MKAARKPIQRGTKAAASAVPESSALQPREAYTPVHHAEARTYAKPVLLLDLGQGPHGPTAEIEFDNGWRRTLDLVTEADGWHPMFDTLPWPERIRLRVHVQRPIETRADGRRFRREGLSFSTVTLNRCSAYVTACMFDVPAESYAAGAVTGHRAAAELLAALKLGYGPAVDRLSQILRDAGEASQESASKASRRGAAVAFLDVVAQGIAFLAKHGRYSEWLDDKIAAAEKQRDYFAQADAIEKQAFVVRMQIAKRLKADRRLKTQPAPSVRANPLKTQAAPHRSAVTELEGVAA